MKVGWFDCVCNSKDIMTIWQQVN